MAEFDPQREWKQISEHYSTLSDEELLQIASGKNELTIIATEVLDAELQHRGLSIPLPVSIPTPDARIEPPQALVEVGRFRFLSEGSLAKAAIESSGIEAFLFDGTMSKYVGLGVRVCVKPEDAEVAEEILSQPIPTSFEVEGVGTYQQPRCPKCNSLDISFGTMPADVLHDRVDVSEGQWFCHACDARWEDEEDTSHSEEQEKEPRP